MTNVNTANTEELSEADWKKIRQKREILGMLQDRKLTSAPEVSKELRISLPTSIVLINDLITAGYIEIVGVGESKGGRKPTLYGFSEKLFYVISCDFDHHSAKMAILNICDQFITPIITIDTRIDDPQIIDKLFKTAEQLINQYNIPEQRIIGVGVDMPGLIDSRQGINYTIKDKTHQQVRLELQKRFKKLVYVDNDARMHAYGEFHFGAAKPYKDAVIIHWSWGIGVGLFINGQLYSGNSGFAGELSHISMIDNGELCVCGKRGCLETLATSNTVLKRVARAFENGEISSLINHFKDNQDEVTIQDVIEYARTGDALCISVLNEVGQAMGRGLSSIIQLFNPEVIVLSGPLSKAKQYVMSPIQQALNRYCLEKMSANTSILYSDLGEQSALLGTSKILFHQFINELIFQANELKNQTNKTDSRS